jgi:hypothetical protein
LLERVPAGAYRELLLDRLAQAIGVSAERFMSIVGPLNSSNSSSPSGPTQREARSTRGSGQSAGRGGLVRQAVKNLLHVPAIAARITAADRGLLDDVAEPGIEVLRELIDTLHAQPAAHLGQLLERWRDQPLGERLANLAAEPLALEDEKSAGDALVGTIRQLARAPLEAELDALQARASELNDMELKRLRELLDLLKNARRA